MEKTLGLTAFFLIIWSGAALTNPPYNERIYAAYRHNDMQAWDVVVAEMEQVGDLALEQQWELLDYYYGQIGRYLVESRKEKAVYVLEKATDLLEHLQQADAPDSLVQAYNAAFLGFRCTLSPWLRSVYGLRSLRKARNSVDSDPLNPYAWMELGQVTWHAPAIAAGGKTRAIQHYEQALALMVAQNFEARKNWRLPYLKNKLARIHSEHPRPSDHR